MDTLEKVLELNKDAFGPKEIENLKTQVSQNRVTSNDNELKDMQEAIMAKNSNGVRIALRKIFER